jgi:hypothetical protein
MLDGFEGHDKIDRVVANRQLASFALDIAAVRSSVGGMCVRDRFARNIDTDDRLGGLCEQGGAVALAAGDINDIESAAQIARQEIPMKVLDHDLTVGTAGHSLAGKFERRRWHFAFENLPQVPILRLDLRYRPVPVYSTGRFRDHGLLKKGSRGFKGVLSFRLTDPFGG